MFDVCVDRFGTETGLLRNRIGFLGDLTVVAPNDIWAVGGYSNDPPPAVGKTLVLHFDEEEWSSGPSPNESPGLHVNDLLSAAASSTQEIWAVGYHLLPHPGIAYDLIEHWNGAAWTNEEIELGFVGDVGDLAKLVMAVNGRREIPDAREKLVACCASDELADCLWSVIVLAHAHDIDLERAFVRTMDELEQRLDAMMN